MEQARHIDTTGAGPQADAGHLRNPARPFHPNPQITAAVVEPLLVHLRDKAIIEMERLLASSTFDPMAITAIRSGSRAKLLCVDRDAEDRARALQLEMITRLEGTIHCLKRGEDASVGAGTAYWQGEMIPLIQQMIEYSKSGESRLTTRLQQLKQQLASFKRPTEVEPEESHENSSDPTSPDARQGVMAGMADVAVDSTRQHKRQERCVLAGLLYDPRTQPETCKLNELAIFMKQRGFEIQMDPRDPVVALGDDDTRMLAIFVGDTFREWAAGVGERLINDLLDPISGLSIPDTDTLRDQCLAIERSQSVTLAVHGSDSLDFSIEVPNGISLTADGVSKELEDLLHVASAFEGPLGFSHHVDFEHVAAVTKVTLRLMLPKCYARFEPDHFYLSQRALERLSVAELTARLQSLKELQDDRRSGAFRAPTSEFESEDSEPISLNAAGPVRIVIDKELFAEHTPLAVLDVLRLAKRLQQDQPHIRYASVCAPEQRTIGQSPSVSERVVFQFSAVTPEPFSPLMRAREEIERKRIALTPRTPMAQYMATAGLDCYPVMGGSLTLEEVQNASERADRIPSWLMCAGIRIRLLTLSVEHLDTLIAAVGSVREPFGNCTLTMTESPRTHLSKEELGRFSYLLYSDDGVPLATVDLSTTTGAVVVRELEAPLYIELCSRIKAALFISTEGALLREREVDQRLLSVGLDITSSLVEELTALANSWSGRTLPNERIMNALDRYLFDESFTVDRVGTKIRCLHHSERLSSSNLC